MSKQKSKNKLAYKLFGILFLLVILISIVNNIRKNDVTVLEVRDNAGVSVLGTVGNSLVCVFQDGRVAVWDWNNLPEKKGDFKAVSDRAVLLDSEHLAAVSKTGKKVLTVYALPSGKKQKEISVGWEDQEVWLRISGGKRTLALIRQNSTDAGQNSLYEFLTLDIDSELIGPALTLTLDEKKEVFVDFDAAPDKTVYAVGIKEKTGRIVAVDLKQGKITWDTVFSDTKEFCSIAVAPDNRAVYAGNRDGLLYKLNADTGEIIQKIQLLEPGETRPVTNDYSVLNLAFSNDGQFYVATITPQAYLLRTDTDTLIHSCSPTSNLTSKIAFSPNNQFFATSDIRASKPIKVWKMPKGK